MKVINTLSIIGQFKLNHCNLCITFHHFILIFNLLAACGLQLFLCICHYLYRRRCGGSWIDFHYWPWEWNR